MANEKRSFSDYEKKDMALSLNRSAQNTFDLLENLLQWSQMDQGITTYNPQKLLLKDIIAECVNLVAEQAREKNIALFEEIPCELHVFADINMLKTVIRNLLSNAVKFTCDEGKVTISAGSAGNNMIDISVADSGIGMSDQMLEGLFRIDVNTKRAGTNGELSTGLGLILCKEFVESHGGKIRAESVENKGSVFHFTIPCSGAND
jgi:signal transduction histidine kinase